MANKDNNTSSGGMGCLSFFVLVAMVASAWMWSQGMGPRAAVDGGMVLSAKITGGLCLLAVLVFVAAFTIPAIVRGLDW